MIRTARPKPEVEVFFTYFRSVVAFAFVDPVLFLDLEARKKDKEEEAPEREDASEGNEGQEDMEEEEEMESDIEAEPDIEETGMVKEAEESGDPRKESVKEEGARSEKDSKQAKEIEDPEKESVKEEVPKSKNDDSRGGEEIKDPKKESVKEEVPKSKNDSRVEEEMKDPEKESEKEEVPKHKKESRAAANSVEQEEDSEDDKKVKASGSKDQQTDGTKEPARIIMDTGTDSQLPPSESFLEESLECFKKEAEHEAKTSTSDEVDRAQKNNGVFEELQLDWLLSRNHPNPHFKPLKPLKPTIRNPRS